MIGWLRSKIINPNAFLAEHHSNLNFIIQSDARQDNIFEKPISSQLPLDTESGNFGIGTVTVARRQRSEFALNAVVLRVL